MLLVGYLYGITSERRLAQEISLNLGYRWFLRYDFDVPTPDHSVLSKARARAKRNAPDLNWLHQPWRTRRRG